MPRFLVFLLSLSLFAALAKADVEQASPQRFSSLIQQDNVILVDVRTQAEANSEKLAGSQVIDFYASDFAERIQELPRDKTLLLYCRSGNRSGKTAAFLHSKGFAKLVNLEGGIIAWKAARLPVVSSE